VEPIPIVYSTTSRTSFTDVGVINVIEVPSSAINSVPFNLMPFKNISINPGS
jgi:hypothetical protein